jgi:hypothetical protein
MPAGSIPGGSVVLRAARVAPPSRSTVAITGTFFDTYHAESSCAGHGCHADVFKRTDGRTDR